MQYVKAKYLFNKLKFNEHISLVALILHICFKTIEVKTNAPELLEKIFKSKRKKCMISTGPMSGFHMSCEEKLQLTRKCLQIINHYEFGATVITKSNRIICGY